jgi:hypothetical protein
MLFDKSQHNLIVLSRYLQYCEKYTNNESTERIICFLRR